MSATAASKKRSHKASSKATPQTGEDVGKSSTRHSGGAAKGGGSGGKGNGDDFDQRTQAVDLELTRLEAEVALRAFQASKPSSHVDFGKWVNS